MWRLTGLAFFVVACGGAPLDANHSHFDAIQRQETRLDVAGNIAFDAERPCAERDEARADACRASARICEIAGQVTDSDATRRCSDGQMRCRAIEAATERCAAP